MITEESVIMPGPGGGKGEKLAQIVVLNQLTCCFRDGSGQGWVHREGLRQVGHCQSVGHSYRDGKDQFRGSRGHNHTADDEA